MSLLKKVEETRSGLKVLGFGNTGTGKTTFGLSFPKIAGIDSEDGMAWYKGREEGKNLVLLANTTSADDLEDILEEIEEDLVGEIETVLTDSETKFYENQQHSALNIAEKRARKKLQDVDDANISQREWGKIKLVGKRIQSRKITLASLGVNIVSIAQEKEIKEKKGENWVVVGYEPDTGKGLKYDYDLVLRFFTEIENGEIIYKAEILKDRTKVFKKGDIVENPSYELWREVVEGKADKKVHKLDFKEDIKKDEESMATEGEQLEKLIEVFKSSLKKADKETKVKVVTKAKELGIENPLTCTDIDKIKELMKFIK